MFPTSSNSTSSQSAGFSGVQTPDEQDASGTLSHNLAPMNQNEMVVVLIQKVESLEGHQTLFQHTMNNYGQQYVHKGRRLMSFFLLLQTLVY